MFDRLNFIVIGAQKSGTTSLFRYLAAHPSIFMPSKKEMSFFSKDVFYAEGPDFYAGYFEEARPDQCLGEASPQYMCFEKCAERIAKTFPDIRLIAVLRNPIERAFSHYRMACRRGLEQRSFDEAVEELIERGGVADEQVDDQTEYVMFGEYGRILDEYLRHFDRSQIHIVWSEALDAETARVMRDVFRFVEVDHTFESPTFETRYHQSGQRRFPDWVSKLVRSSAMRVGRTFSIQQKVQGFLFRFETEWNLIAEKVERISPDAHNLLRDYYRPDMQHLANRFEVSLPWSEWSVAAPDPAETAAAVDGVTSR